MQRSRVCLSVSCEMPYFKEDKYDKEVELVSYCLWLGIIDETACIYRGKLGLSRSNIL
jgi:hypothetical protein